MQHNERYILMVEDDADDQYITETTLKQLGFDLSIRYLSKSNEIAPFLDQNPRPAIILVDYNIGPDNGLETLKNLKAHPAYKSIPVILLSDNKLERFVQESYANGVSSFIQKPVSMAGTYSKIETFFKYWLEVAET